MEQTVKVSVCMITYGHEKFIEEAINGVLMQECDFEVELIIANDSSPDLTDEIIQNILENHPKAYRIKYIKHDNNLGMMSNSIFAIKHCKAEYIALCEGDDYWIDPLKLQKQIAFLDNNPKVFLSHSDVDLIDVCGNLVDNHTSKLWNYKNDYLDYQFSIFYPIAFTCTAVFRNVNIAGKLQRKNVSGDWMLWVLLTLKGDAKFINEKLAVYRTGVGVSVNAIWYKNFCYRSLFLLNQLSLDISFKKNYWLLRGAIYFFLIYISRKINIYLITKIANKFKIKAY